MRTLVLALALTALGAAAASAEYDSAAAQAHIDRILGRLGEDRIRPAGRVFEGVTVSPTSSAERYLELMDEQFSRPLGVGCAYCHDPEDWSRDAKHKFAVSRAMWKMVYTINQDLLRKIEDVPRKARVGCATCHRGELVPPRSLD